MEQIKTFDKYAIFQTGGKQYQAIEGKTLAIEKIEGGPGDIVEFDEVLLRRSDKDTVEVGKPTIEGQKVRCSIIKQTKGPKLIAFRFKRRKKVRVKRGHRQLYTVIRIEAI
jgi:large subunit ribosomal protein L21